MLSVGAVEQEVEAVSAGLGEKLSGFAVDCSVDEDGGFFSVPIMHVVRGDLVIPDHLSSVGI